LCRIFGQMCRKNGLSLTPRLKEKVVHHFLYLREHPSETFGNARLVRNTFEAAINAQASRLASRADIDSQALSTLEEEDLLSPVDSALAKYRQSGRGYLVKCDYCGETYSWTPD